MESSEARRQLLEAQRLAAATQEESTAVARWAWPVMTVALIATFASYGLLEEPWQGIASFVWCVFVALWVHAIRRDNRATPRRPERTAEERRRAIREWIVLLVAANAITFGLSRISWLAAGVGMAIFCSAAGGHLAWRSRRS